MHKLTKTLFSPPSVRLNLIVICGIVLLLTASLTTMAWFSYQALHQEAILDAEEALEGAVYHVDNILVSVEQSTGNIYSEVLANLDKPERMHTYAKQLVESNPYIVGCAICFKPDYYPDRKLFMTYTHHKGGIVKKKGASTLVTSNKFGKKPYTEHPWYNIPMTTGRPYWTDPLPEEEDEGVTLSFSLPIVNQKQERVGVLVADLSVKQFSKYVVAGTPTPHGYTVMIGSNGSFIVHPDPDKLINQTVFTQTEGGVNPSVRKVAESALAGEEGFMSFSLDGQDWCVFYKPFRQVEVPSRSMEKLNWSIGIVYSEDEIFNAFSKLVGLVLMISVISLVLFYLICRFVLRQQMKSLRQLTHITKRIAAGHYDDPIPDVKRNDEIGLLYQHLQLMKQSLTNHVSELEQMTGKLKRHREVMHEVHAKQQSVDRMMTFFLHFVTDKMLAPTADIERCVKTLCNNYRTFAPEEISLVIDTINKKSETVIVLINNMLDTAENETTHD